ncbi:MAG TPA: hypothetical protein VFE36_16495 [Candidatus Baltobacteraceae bacterium]|nr:hypothetical protein [Candidatus Baltobacteraceae bacterium]
MKAKLESMIAVCALLVATIAAAAAAYQTYVINEQFSATVWPYVGFDTTRDTSNQSFTLAVRNVGLGPAIIRTSIATVDGKPMGPGTTGNPVITAFEGDIAKSRDAEAKLHRHGQISISASSLTAGDVLPAGNSLMLFRVKGPDLFARVEARRPHFDLSLCYCSVLGRCWTRRLQDPIPEPRDARSCPLPK